MTIKIEIQKTYEEVDIAGNIYRIDLHDDQIRKYQAAFEEFQKESKKLNDKPFEKMTKKEMESAEKKNYELMEKITDLILGDGSFKKVYADVGRSLMVVTNVLLQLMDVIQGRMEKMKLDQKAYYTGK